MGKTEMEMFKNSKVKLMSETTEGLMSTSSERIGYASVSFAERRGGIGLVISEISEPNPKGPAPMAKTTTPPSDQWTVTDVDSDFIDALQA
uniref:Uncharacterized protein n=1 Tax=Solanum lycopersicum TaxID=4081 RepID=A0A3Q7EYJ4_SOLLC